LAPLLAVRLLWQGRTRFFRALTVFIRIGMSYRKARRNHATPAHADFPDDRHTLHRRNADRLFHLFQDNGGTWIKAGQFLSARPDLLPMEYIDALQPLQNQVRPIPFASVDAVLRAVWGEQWKRRFLQFDETPVAAASNAQVYKAQLTDQRWVAVKILNPDIRALYAQDMLLYRILARLIGLFIHQVDFVAAVNVFLTTLERELDFLQEARNIADFQKLKHIAGIRSLTLIPEHSNAAVITTEWIEGQPLLEFLKNAERKTQIDTLALLQNSYVQQVIRFGKFQGDPHPGNYLIDSDHNLVIVDFGHMGVLSERERLNYVKIILAVIDGNARAFKESLTDGGFTDLADDFFSEKLLQLLQSVASKPVEDIEFQEVERLLREILHCIRQRRARVPAHYLVTGRVFITLAGLFKLFNVTPEQIDIRKVLLS
jgi:ubiquinone biosynthesis protein